MKIYDLSKDLFSAQVFPGDPSPECRSISSIEDGAVCNLTGIFLGSHNGTHIDAPKHFFRDGKAIDEINLYRCIGECKLVSGDGQITAKDIEAVLSDGTKRLLIKGDITITIEAARKMTDMGLEFIGVEGLTVGPESSPMEVHLELLSHEVVILESAVMEGIPEGKYFLSSAPLKYGGVDAAQCRPVLIDCEMH